MKHRLRLALVAGLLGLPAPAFAGLLTFDFMQHSLPGLSPERTFTGTDGATLLASALSTSPFFSAGLGAASGYGLFVCSSLFCGSRDGLLIDYYPVDGGKHWLDADEGIGLRFDRQVQLVSAEFFLYRHDFNGSNRLDAWNGSEQLFDELSFKHACSRSGQDDRGQYLACDFLSLAGGDAADLFGSSFSFWADGRHDSFKLRSLTAFVPDPLPPHDPPPGQVPEPGPLALLGLGLAGLIAWRRRVTR